MNLKRCFCLFVVVGTLSASSFANQFHLLVKKVKVREISIQDFAAKVAENFEMLNELDERGLTVLGRAIAEGAQELTEWLLLGGMTNPGRTHTTTLADFAFEHRQGEMNVFLLYFERFRLGGLPIADAIYEARKELDLYRALQEQRRPIARGVAEPTVQAPDPIRFELDDEPTIRPFNGEYVRPGIEIGGSG